jgi:D-alanine-D-alanine ligase
VPASDAAEALLATARQFHSETQGATVMSIFGPRSVEDRTYVARVPENQSGGNALDEALRSLGYEVLSAPPEWRPILARIPRSDIAFINAHGEYGEDGSIQGMLRYADVPFTGCGVLSSALCLDKVRTKQVAERIGVMTPAWYAVGGDDSWLPGAVPEGPWLVKPRFGGSSVLCRRANAPNEVRAWIAQHRASYRDWLVEQIVAPAREITVGVLSIGGVTQCLPPLQIDADDTFYSEEAKMHAHWHGGVRYVCPAPLTASERHTIDHQTLRMFEELGCRGYARFDWLITDQEAFFLEANSNPGISREGNFALAADVGGISYRDLVLSMLSTAREHLGVV